MRPTPPRRRRAWLARAGITLALLAPAGCGSAVPQRLDASGARSLDDMLANVRASAQQGDRAGVLGGLATLRAQIDRLAASGSLPAAEARALRSGVSRARAAAQRELAPAPVSALSEPAPAAESPPPDRHGHDHGKGHGHDHGGGGDGGQGGGGD